MESGRNLAQRGYAAHGYVTICESRFRNRWGRFQEIRSPLLPHVGQALAESLAQERLDGKNVEGPLEGQSVE
jgi:hypothetical protein